VLAYFGFIHSEKVAVGASFPIAVGYLLLAVLCFGFSYLYRPGKSEEASAMAPG